MADDLNVVVRGIVVEQLSGADATALMRASAAVERRAAVLKTLVAKRAVDANTWSAGHRSPEDWLGEELGAGFGSAKATLGASGAGRAAGAERGGAQRRAVFGAAQRGGGRGDAGERGVVAQLGSQRQHERVAAEVSPGEVEVALQRRCSGPCGVRGSTRFLREWIDNEGAWRFEGKGTAADGARFRAALATETDRVFKEARKADRRESHKAYRYDALMRLVTGSGEQGQGRAGRGRDSRRRHSARRRRGHL